MFPLLLFIFINGIWSCPLQTFDPNRLFFIKSHELLCIEFDIVIERPYDEIIIIPPNTLHNKISLNIVTENNVEKQVDLQIQNKCWSMPISLYGVLKDPLVCMRYTNHVWPKTILGFSGLFHVLKYDSTGKIYTACNITTSLVDVPVQDYETENICGNSTCNKCVSSCKLLLYNRGSYICDGKINNIQVPTLFSNHETPFFPFKATKYISKDLIIWCIDFLLIPGTDTMNFQAIGYNSRGSIIHIKQACKPFGAQENAGKLCFISNKNTELDHLKIEKMNIYYPSHYITVKNAEVRLLEIHLETKEKLIPDNSCVSVSCEKWIMLNKTCFSNLSTYIKDGTNINKSLLFIIIFILLGIITIILLMSLAKKSK